MIIMTIPSNQCSNYYHHHHYHHTHHHHPSLPGVLISLDDLLQTSLEGHLINEEENYDVGAVDCR